MAEKKQAEQQLKTELERARSEIDTQAKSHLQQSENERTELQSRVQLLEERLKQESSERHKLEGTIISVLTLCPRSWL